MLFLRNPEVKKMLIIYILITILSVTGAFFINFSAVIYTFFLCLLFIVSFLLFTFKRYHAISNLSHQLDKILHGEKTLNFIPDKEGELALLSSEIFKATIRLQEQAELLQKEKMTLTNSIADISHQIRTPLTSICMIISRFQKEKLTIQEKNSYVREVNKLLTRLEWLITALLKIAQLESDTVLFEKKSVNVKKLIEKVMEPLAVFIDIKQLLLHLDINSECQFIGDFLWSAEAIGNIVKNCIEHLPEKESLSITASENALYTEIIISDTGIGINPEDLPHLFERFYKGKNSGPQNAGIGLSLSRMIIMKQNGTIKAASHEPHGAVFHIRFYKGIV